MTRLAPGKQKFTLVSPSGYGMVRMYHQSITANHRKGLDARVGVPPLVTRAKLIVQQRRLVPVLLKEKQELR